MNEDLEIALRLWAKTERGNEGSAAQSYHPLLFHMLDVAAVSDLLWDAWIPPGIKRRIENSFGGKSAKRLILFGAGAHDIGKASPGFQKKVNLLAEATGLRFSVNDKDFPHGFISALVIRENLGKNETATILGQIVGGHHGVFPRACELSMGRDTLGNAAWTKVRTDLLKELSRIVGFEVDAVVNQMAAVADPFVVPFLAGFVSVADWIASNQTYFPCVAQHGNPTQNRTDEYWQVARRQATNALQRLGWLPKVRFKKETSFRKMFPKYPANAMQKVVIKAARKQMGPYLLIDEAPMGQGKTEAALYAADLAMCRGYARGFYMAMPTQATTNAMHGRVLNEYLKNRGHEGKLNLQLVHGNALLANLVETIDELKDEEVADFDVQSVGHDLSMVDANSADVEARSWFAAKKRPLLATFGVGTIDQSLLSVLQTKHWFVRMFGLAGKVVIFDEVHAYDAYMTTILERLLNWLAELDCTVILLSATLPDARRRSLAMAYSGRNDAEYQRYPRVTLALPRHYPADQVDNTPGCIEVPIGATRTVSLLFAKSDLDILAKSLSEKLAEGGCTAIICNTVDRSIEVHKHLSKCLNDTECSLFHARTLQMWRREREEEVLLKFGRGVWRLEEGKREWCPSNRPHRAILIATQVIEQSLDLDFDLMVSEIAPVDLLLQRLGRLHRHQRVRPKTLESPEFIVLCDAETAGSPPKTFGKGIEFVYDRYVLLRTWLTLRHLSHIKLPTEIEYLVEAVYSKDGATDADGWAEALAQAKDQMEIKRLESEKTAGRILVAKPKDPADLIEEFNEQLMDDEDPEIHKAVRAATREGDPSITVVMLPEGDNLKTDPKIPEVRELLDRSAKLSHRGLFHALLEKGKVPKEWANNAHLRFARVLQLDSRHQGRIDEYTLTVDKKIGIEIARPGGG